MWVQIHDMAQTSAFQPEAIYSALNRCSLFCLYKRSGKNIPSFARSCAFSGSQSKCQSKFFHPCKQHVGPSATKSILACSDVKPSKQEDQSCIRTMNQGLSVARGAARSHSRSCLDELLMIVYSVKLARQGSTDPTNIVCAWQKQWSMTVSTL